MTTSVRPVVGMKNWDEKTKRWVGVVCQVVVDGNGKENITVLDVMSAEYEIDIDTQIEKSIETKPWIVQ